MALLKKQTLNWLYIYKSYWLKWHILLIMMWISLFVYNYSNIGNFTPKAAVRINMSA